MVVVGGGGLRQKGALFQPLLRENTPSLSRLDHYLGVKLKTCSVFKGILGWGRGRYYCFVYTVIICSEKKPLL
jgi:hypothetical protein